MFEFNKAKLTLFILEKTMGSGKGCLVACGQADKLNVKPRGFSLIGLINH